MRLTADKALSHWRGEGLLTAEQIAVLAASLENIEKPADSARAVRLFGFIGAVLTGLGAILFVASNWQGMSPLERTLVLLAGYGVTVVAAVLVEKRGFPLVGEAVWLLATLVLGANIFLIAQTYNLALTMWQGTLAWTIGAVAMGYARRSAAQAAVAVPLAILTIGWAGGGSGWFFDDQLEFLFADAGLRAVLPLLGLALVALSTLLPLREDLRFASTPCFRWGSFIVAASLIVTTAHTEVATAFYRADFNPKQIGIMLAATALVVAAALVGKVDSLLSRPALAALLAALALPLVKINGAPWVGIETGGVHLLFGLYVVGVFGAALFITWLGMQARNPRLVNIGMVSTTLIIIIQYFGWSFELLDRSLAFIAGGALLMGLSVFMERRRRGMLARIAA
ncbi:MAG: DUF2157 domain-containing protein [Acidobacteriota bacterium]|jgi:uncharacterized membrane protein